jgi:uncharacterized LabA/DUF88 family protein
MKTAIYIDGYNLYYSRVQGTAYKWLDVAALFRNKILRVQDPVATVTAFKYFTAPIKANYARHGQTSEEAQTQYLRALAAREPGLIEIIQGFHIFKPTSLPLHETGLPPSKARRQSVWMIEEKLTDVQLALTNYRDALRGGVDQVVVCSNDSDVEPALQLVRRDAPKVRIGLVMPLPPHAKGQGIVSNKRLTAQAHWVRHHILDGELAASQLPAHVPTKNSLQVSRSTGSHPSKSVRYMRLRRLEATCPVRAHPRGG